MTDALTSTIFAQGMALLAERWNREVSPGLSRIYATALRDLGADRFIVGVERAVAELTFFPSAKEIRDLATPIASAESRAGEVFAAVLATGWHTPHGRRYSLDAIETACGEPARRAVVAVGGPQRLITLTDDALPFVLRDFAHAFAEFERELSSRVTVDRYLSAGRSRPALASTDQPRQIRRGDLTPIGASIVAALPAGILEDPNP